MWRRMPPSAWLGSLIILLVVFAAALAPLLAPHSQTAPIGGVWDPPSLSEPLGTDSLGRDMASRLMFGARTSVGIALVCAVLAFVFGIMSGFIAAAVGGWTDALLSRAADVLMAVPVLIYALMVFSVLGTSIPIMLVTIAVLEAARVFRVARAVAAGIVVLEFVQIARLRGEGLGWILLREILPNALPPLVAEFGMRFCFIFLFIASLSFLGLGIQPPTPDWGSMVRENAQAISFGAYAPLYPAAAIALLTVGVNMMVDWLLALHARPGGAMQAGSGADV
jgi:peptide/nickel transport system permease protein